LDGVLVGHDVDLVPVSTLSVSPILGPVDARSRRRGQQCGPP
jgi:hypothetical protein